MPTDVTALCGQKFIQRRHWPHLPSQEGPFSVISIFFVGQIFAHNPHFSHLPGSALSLLPPQRQTAPNIPACNLCKQRGGANPFCHSELSSAIDSAKSLTCSRASRISCAFFSGESVMKQFDGIISPLAARGRYPFSSRSLRSPSSAAPAPEPPIVASPIAGAPFP